MVYRWSATDTFGELIQQKGPNYVYPPVRRCIYCGTTSGALGKEHVVPFGLGGNMILPRASCKACSKITGGMEQTCLRAMLGPLRIHMGLPTRRPDERPSILSVPCVHEDGRKKTIEAPAELYPFIIHGMVLPPPPALGGPTGKQQTGTLWVKMIVEDELKKLVGPGWRADLINIAPWMMARLIAKIAHSYAVADQGLDSFTPFLLDLILGKEPTPAYDFIGGNSAMTPAQAGVLHQLHVNETDYEGSTYLTVRVRLFAELGAPEYLVVVGKINRPLNRPGFSGGCLV